MNNDDFVLVPGPVFAGMVNYMKTRPWVEVHQGMAELDKCTTLAAYESAKTQGGPAVGVSSDTKASADVST